MIGLNATLYKSVAFGLSACFVGAAGGVYAAWVHYIDPSDVFDILYSVKPIVMALIGGLGSPLGVLVAAPSSISACEEVVWRNYIQIHSGVLGVLIVVAAAVPAARVDVAAVPASGMERRSVSEILRARSPSRETSAA